MPARSRSPFATTRRATTRRATTRRAATRRAATRRALAGAAALAALPAFAAAAAAAGATATAGSAAATPSAFPVTISTAAGPVTIPHRPVRIISLSPSSTEDLFAIGAGSRVVAVDNDSSYPRAAPRTSLSGLTPNLEAIAHYRPDLVVITYDTALVKSLGVLHVPVLYEPAPRDLAGAYAQIRQLGTATGTSATAGRLVASMRARVASLVAHAPRFATPPSYFYELSASPYYSATSHTLFGSVLGLFGLRDIADAARGASGGYPELSQEYILAADPQLVFLTDTGADGGQTPAKVAARPGWAGISAVARHDVFALDPDIAARWGPRLVDLAAAVEHDLTVYEAHAG